MPYPYLCHLSLTLIPVTCPLTLIRRGLSAADALAKLSRNGTTGTGHLLHMPAHIYLRTGRWVDSLIHPRDTSSDTPSHYTTSHHLITPHPPTTSSQPLSSHTLTPPLPPSSYVECIASSLIAIASDRMYEAKCLVPYVPTHNVAMLVSAALYSGRMQLAVQYSPYILMVPDAAVYLSAIYASPKDIVMVRFGQWDQVFYLHEQQQKVRID